MRLTERRNAIFLSPTISIFVLILISLAPYSTFSIRFPDQISEIPKEPSSQPLKTVIFALGSFWRSEAVFGCLDGVVRTTAGYAGGSKVNPEYRSLGDHAESVQIEYDPRSISFRQLLEVFWTSHDSRQVFGQGPDVGNQYRSIIFTNGTEESSLAAQSKEREQTRSKISVVTTQIQQLGTFYPAEPEHQTVMHFYLQEQPEPAVFGKKPPQSLPLRVKLSYKQVTNLFYVDLQKFELKRNPFLLQLIGGNLSADELERSSLAAKLNGYAAELCPPRMQRHIDAKINDILRKGWPILKEV